MELTIVTSAKPENQEGGGSFLLSGMEGGQIGSQERPLCTEAGERLGEVPGGGEGAWPGWKGCV